MNRCDAGWERPAAAAPRCYSAPRTLGVAWRPFIPGKSDAAGPAISWAVLALAAALPVSIAGVNASAAALTALLLWAFWTGEPVAWDKARTPFSLSLLAYVAVAVIVSAAGVFPSVSFRMLYKDLHKAWLAWLLLAALPLARRERAPLFMGAGFALVSVVGIGQTLLLRMPDLTMMRAHGFVHPVAFGELVAFGFLGGVCFRSNALLALTGAALFCNQTRGTLLGVAAGLLALSLADARRRKIAGAVILGVLLVLGLWELLPNNHTIREMVARTRQPGPNAALARLTFWRVGWEIFRDHPWLGVGPGNYKSLFERYFQGIFSGESVWGSAHNLYIHQAAERGLLGLSALALVLGTMTWRAWDRVRRSADALNLWALSACAAFLVMNLTEVAFQNEQVMSLLLFVWCLAESARPI